MRATDQKPEYQGFEWLSVPIWIVIIVCVFIGVYYA